MRSYSFLVLPAVLLSFSQITAAYTPSESAQEPFSTIPSVDNHHGNCHSEQKPNFLVFLTDDQDRRMNSLDHLPLVKKYIRDQGTEFINYYTTTAMCCPSRVSLWSGQFAHNHNVTDESPPHGNLGLREQIHPSYIELIAIALTSCKTQFNN
jgi:N-acetylglucosamine-6-sulfatase